MSDTIAVVARSVCTNTALREELKKKYPGIVFNDTNRVLAGEELIAFLKGHRRAITGLEKIDSKILEKTPDLKHISKYGVGLDMLNLEDLNRQGVTLGWSAGVNRRSVAELALTFMLTLIRSVHLSEANVAAQKWERAKGRQLSEKTIGIIGCGNIGKDLVRLLKPFGCRVLAHDIVDYGDFYREFGVESVDLKTLFASSDIVSIHTPKNSSTLGLLGRPAIAQMRRGTFVVNTARGGLVDEVALLEALNSGQIAGAALDVLEQEPPADYSLLEHPRLISTPHIGGNADEAVMAMGRAAIDNLENPRNALEFVGLG